MTHKMPQLPYAIDALAPHISAETLQFHYGRHLQTYIDNLNKLVAGTLYENMSLEEIICKAPDGAVFNNAAQAWNHEFYFYSLSPTPHDIPTQLGAQIVKSFESLQAFKEQLLQSATSLFGSGWTWLVMGHDQQLRIVNEGNAGNPMRRGERPLLTIDVWEHAYYIDYRNRRADYLKAVWELINWDVVGKRMDNHEECNVYF